MKILYLANDRRAAERSTPALRTVASDVAVAWASDRDEARRWIGWNRDVAAVIIDVESDAPAWVSFVSQIRALGVAAPVIVVSPGDPAHRLTALEAVADAVVANDLSFPRTLPDGVRLALHDTRKAAPAAGPVPALAPARRRLRLLYVGDATLARECLGRSLDVVEAVPEPGTRLETLPADAHPGARVSFDMILVEHAHPGVQSLAILKDIAARQLQVPVVIVAEWDEALAVSMLEQGAVDFVAKSRASLRAVLFRLHRLIAHSVLLEKYSALRALSTQAHLGPPPRTSAASEAHQAREANLVARLAHAAEGRQQVEQRLAQREAEFRHAEQRATVELQTALRDFTRREAELEAALIRETAERRALEAKLGDVETALGDAAQRAVAEESGREHAIERQLQVEADLARESAARAALQQHLATAKIALQRADARHASAASAADARLADGQARFDARLSEAAAAQTVLEARLVAAESARGRSEEQAAGATHGLERKLADLSASLERAEQEAATERRAAADQAAERAATFDLELAHAVAARQALEKALQDADAVHAHADRDHASQLAAAAERQTGVVAQLAGEVANRQALEHALEAAAARLAEHQTQAETRMAQAAASAASALEAAEQRAASERQAASAQASERQTRFDKELAREVANRQVVEKALKDLKAARVEAERAHAGQIAAAATRLSEYQTQAEVQMSQAAASAASALEAAEQRATTERQAAAEQAATAINALEHRLADLAASLERAGQHLAAQQHAASEQAAERQTRVDADLAREVANRQAVEKALKDLEAARVQAEREHAAQITAAAKRQESVERALAAEVASRQRLEQALRNAETARADADREHAGQIAAAATRLSEHQTQAEVQMSQAAASAASALEAAEQRAAGAQQAAAGQTAEAINALESRLAAAAASLERAEHQATAERRTAAEQATARQAAHDAALAAAQDQLQRQERTFTEERASLEIARRAVESDLARQRKEQAALQQSLDQVRAAGEDTQRRLEAALAETSRDRQTMAQLREQLDARVTELDATRGERETLRTEAVLVPQLRTQIDDIVAAQRRAFDHAPASLCRWHKAGGMTGVSRAAAALLGYATPEELQKVDFSRAVFESSNELQWLVDRCLTSGATESIETTWMKKDGGRIVVRVLAVSTAPESVDLAVQDITTLRVLEEKLRHSQRMESVGRYGSEVAVTCDNLLRHVEQEGQDWLNQIDSPTARYHGQLLLDEVTRAAAFLRQLAVYGDEQKNAAELVDVNEVLVDLEPVLSRVAGRNIDLVLPKPSRPLNLDVDVELVERILINVAAYGRERMPSGGRLVIEVAPVMLERAFVAKYPNVRPGAHVLLTVNEVRSKASPEGAAAAHLTVDANGALPDHPGVDLGALQGLVSDCGGHLWMKADPPGDMVLKIHLPRRVLDRPEPRTPVKQPVLARWISRVAGAHH